MEECKPILNTGLRGVTVARGYLVQDLASSATFEEVVHLLLYEKLPDEKELAALTKRLAAERPIPPEILAALKTRPAV